MHRIYFSKNNQKFLSPTYFDENNDPNQPISLFGDNFFLYKHLEFFADGPWRFFSPIKFVNSYFTLSADRASLNYPREYVSKLEISLPNQKKVTLTSYFHVFSYGRNYDHNFHENYYDTRYVSNSSFQKNNLHEEVRNNYISIISELVAKGILESTNPTLYRDGEELYKITSDITKLDLRKPTANLGLSSITDYETVSNCSNSETEYEFLAYSMEGTWLLEFPDGTDIMSKTIYQPGLSETTPIERICLADGEYRLILGPSDIHSIEGGVYIKDKNRKDYIFFAMLPSRPDDIAIGQRTFRVRLGSDTGIVNDDVLHVLRSNLNLTTQPPKSEFIEIDIKMSYKIESDSNSTPITISFPYVPNTANDQMHRKQRFSLSQSIGENHSINVSNTLNPSDTEPLTNPGHLTFKIASSLGIYIFHAPFDNSTLADKVKNRLFKTGNEFWLNENNLDSNVEDADSVILPPEFFMDLIIGNSSGTQIEYSLINLDGTPSSLKLFITNNPGNPQHGKMNLGARGNDGSIIIPQP